jgi:hypothetical protein
MRRRPSSSSPTTVTVEPDSLMLDYFVKRAAMAIVDADE